MTYDSPKQIRRRRLRAEDRPARKTRVKYSVRVWTEEEWAEKRDYHLRCLEMQLQRGDGDSAAIYARTLVHLALLRRALEIMRDHHRAYWKAMDIAKHELLDCEIE